MFHVATNRSQSQRLHTRNHAAKAGQRFSIAWRQERCWLSDLGRLQPGSLARASPVDQHQKKNVSRFETLQLNSASPQSNRSADAHLDPTKSHCLSSRAGFQRSSAAWRFLTRFARN